MLIVYVVQIDYYHKMFLKVKLLNTRAHQKQPPEEFYKKGTLKNFAKYTVKLLCRSFIFDKAAGHGFATLLKNGL